jgi:hypothetical protein
MSNVLVRASGRLGYRKTIIGHFCWMFLIGTLASCGGKGGSTRGSAASDRLDTNAAQADTGAGQTAAQNDTPTPPSLSDEQFAAAALKDGERPGSADTTGGAWRIIDVPGLGTPAVVHSPAGWFALSTMATGGKVITAVESALYRSSDAIHWTSVALTQDNDLATNSLVYGAGRYLMSVRRLGSTGPSDGLWTSSDGEQWSEQAFPATDVPFGSNFAYVEKRFFGLGFGNLAISETGDDWKVVPISVLSGAAAAYGNGIYLLTGSGPMETSPDGWVWQEHPVDCSLPGACISDPGGAVYQDNHEPPVFAEGRFYSGQLSSADGVNWRAEPGPPVAVYLSRHFLSYQSDPGGVAAGLPTWTSGGAVQTLRMVDPTMEAAHNAGYGGLHQLQLGSLPDRVSGELDDGLTCQTAACVLVDGFLLLVPPPGTPPLVDRVPRVAGGVPLLSRDCPVSNMTFCDDYAARTGCVCHPEAPRAPAYCEDVSQYRCAGQFTPTGNEWQLDNVGPGGCDCKGGDPNQPPSFGTTCSNDASVCRAPLGCLPIDPPPSEAPIPPRSICTTACEVDADCPSWQATGFCAGPVQLKCSNGSCQPRSCD